MRGFAVLVLAGACVFATSSQVQTADEKELKRIELETARLEQQNDVGLGKYLADDWVCVGSRHLSKAEFLKNVTNNLDTHENGINPYTIEKRDLQVRVFGDTAVVTYFKEYRLMPAPSNFFNEDDTDVFTRDTSGWHLRYTRIYPVQTQSAAK
jgi:hypothetical protein